MNEKANFIDQAPKDQHLMQREWKLRFQSPANSHWSRGSMPSFLLIASLRGNNYNPQAFQTHCHFLGSDSRCKNYNISALFVRVFHYWTTDFVCWQFSNSTGLISLGIRTGAFSIDIFGEKIKLNRPFIDTTILRNYLSIINDLQTLRLRTMQALLTYNHLDFATS